VMRVGIVLALASLVIGELLAPTANRTAREFPQMFQRSKSAGRFL